MPDDPLCDFIALHAAECQAPHIEMVTPPYGDYEEALCPVCDKVSDRFPHRSGAGRDYEVVRYFEITLVDGRHQLGQRLSLIPEVPEPSETWMDWWFG